MDFNLIPALFGLALTTERITLTGVLIVVTVLASLYAEQSPQVKAQWLFNPYMVKNRNEYYRFITSGFIHGDFMHLLFNMITFYYFGSVVEIILVRIFESQWIGWAVFLLFYLSAIVVADLPRYFRYLRNHRTLANSLGASGGVSAILLFSILYLPEMKVSLFFIPIGIPGFMFAILYLFYSAYMDKQGGDRIAHDAHLYGALYGILIAIAVYPPVVFSFAEYIMSGNYF